MSKIETFAMVKDNSVRSKFVETEFRDKNGNTLKIFIDTKNKKIYVPKQFSHYVKPTEENRWRFTEYDSAEKLSAAICLQMDGLRMETMKRICEEIRDRYGI